MIHNTNKQLLFFALISMLVSCTKKTTGPSGEVLGTCAGQGYVFVNNDCHCPEGKVEFSNVHCKTLDSNQYIAKMPSTYFYKEKLIAYLANSDGSTIQQNDGKRRVLFFETVGENRNFFPFSNLAYYEKDSFYVDFLEVNIMKSDNYVVQAYGKILSDTLMRISFATVDDKPIKDSVTVFFSKNTNQ